MGWMDEYNKALKKYKKEEQQVQNKSTKNTVSTKTTSKSSGSSWMQEYERALPKYQAEEEEKAAKKVSDKITVGRLTSPKKEEEKEEKRSWFQKGVFEDGYQAGDISKAILGTLADVGQDALTGIVGMGESAVDAFMSIAPYSLQPNDPFMSPVMREQQTKIFEEAKKKSSEFVAKDLYDEQAVANQLLSNMYGSFGNVLKMQNGQMLTEEDLALARENSKYAKQYIDEQMEAESVLGEKSDALMQSAGVLAAQAGLQAVGVPWYLTSGVTSFGSEIENALKQGATHEEALISGAISAGAEVLSEKMFGGDIFTKNGADLATKYLSREVSNKVVRNLIKAGYDVAGEGFEEAVSQAISRLGSSVYKDEKLKDILFSEEAWDEYIESAVGGMALGGGMTAINVAQSNAAGVDYTTGLTDNEQKVVDKLYKEWQTKDMDSQEKKKLYDDILRGMDRGTIDADTISEILDSDSHKAYDSLTKESEEFKTLYKTPFEKLSAEQNARLKELQTKHETKAYEKALEEARNKRFTDTWDLVRGTRLEESFREKLRMNEDFKADFDRFKGSKHEEAARKTLQSAIDFVSKEGKKLNNTNAMHDVIDLAANIASETGKVFYVKDGETIKQEFIKRQTEEISKLEGLKKRTAEQDKILAKMKDILANVESGKTKVNGDITADGITLNLDSENPLIFTTGHEVTHGLEKAKSYDKLRDALFSYAKAKNVDIDAELTDRKARYAGIKNADPEKELVSDLVGRYIFDDYDFIHNISTEHRNVAQKIYDEIKHLCKLATAGSKAARDLERAKRQFEKAFREANEASKAKTDTKYSISDKNIKDTSTGYAYDETYFTMSYTQDGKVVGTLEYGEYDGEANVKMIRVEPEYRRKGIATKLMQELQNKYPDTEINFGMATPDGAKLLESITYDVTDEAVVADRQKLKDLQTELNDLQEKLDVLYDTENLTEEQDAELHKLGDRWQEVYETIHYLAKDLRGKKATRTFVKTDAKYSLSDSDTDNAYFDAVVNRDWETAERMVEEAAKNAGYTKVVYHGTDARFTKFDTDEESTAREQHAWMADYPDGTIFLAEDYDVADGYGERVMNLLLDTSDMKVFEEPDMYAHRAMDDKYGYEVYNYPVIAVKGKDMTIYATLDNTLVKSADTVTYGDGGEIVPLSERFKHDNDDIRYSLTEYSPEQKKEHNKSVLDHFGKTYKWAETGYVLLDGSKLDLSGKHNGAPGGYRTVDHRDITDALGYDYGGDSYSGSLIQFMSEGNIRISPESNGINLSVKPNKAQEMALSDFISRARGEVLLDIDDLDGYTVASVEYPRGTHANKVLNDIREWFDNGKQPEVSNLSQFRSMSNSGEAPFGRSINSVYGKDVIKQNPFGEIAPIVDPNNQPSKAWTVEELFPDEQTAQAELDNLTQQQQSIYGRMMDAMNAEDMDTFTQETIEYEKVTKRIEELENEISETEMGRADSLMGEDAPPEMDVPYYETEPTVLTKKATADIVRDVRKSLDLTNPQMADCKDIVEQWRSGAIQTREQLVDALQDKFGKYTDVEEDYLLQEIKREIRTRGINVSKDIQRNFPDYVDLMRRNRGKVRFSKQGLAVDEVYQELNSLYPGYFPMEMYSDGGRQNAADQLERIIEIANTPHIKETERNKGIDNIEEAADIIINGIDNFRLNQDLTLSERESRGAFADLVRNADRYAPPEDIAPVPPELVSQTKETKATKGTPEKVTAQKSSGKVAEVLTEASRPDKKTGTGMGLVSQVVDKGMAVENLAYKTGNEELQPKYQAALPSTTEAKAQYFMENGAEGVKPFKETVTEIQKSGKQNDFERYMYHAHNVDRMSLEQRFGVPNKAVYGDSITADVSRAEVKRYEAKNPEFKQWAEEIYAITKWQRSLLVDKGIISQETADLWEKMYPHYVPITRKDAKGANVYVPLDTNKTGVNAPIKKAVGGNSDIEPMLNTIAQRIEQTYRAVARNSFGIELKNTLGTTINSQPNAVDVDGVIDTLEDQDSKLLKPGTLNSNPTFTVFENGERVEFEITEELFDSLKPAGKILGHRFESSDKKIVRGVGKALEARRNLLTNWNPVFAWYRNPIKDIQDVAVNSQHPIQTYVSMPKAIVELARNGKWAQEYHANGGKSNTYYDSRKNEFVEEKGIKKLFGKYEAAGEFIEEVPRLSEYIASRLNGRSVERSMLDAARVTTNFTAGGDFTKFLNSHGFTFLNASVQGATQHVRNFRESYHTEGAMGTVKTLAKYVIAGIPTIVLNSLKWDDDEEYEELNDYVKQNYYVLWKTDDGKFVRIPKGRTAAVVGELMQQMENLVTGDDEADFSTFFELFMNNIAPSNPLENNIIAPIAQTLTNKAWYGGDLVPSRLQKLPAEEQYDESTDILSRKIGEATGTSPYKWNYLIDQYSGGLGDVFLPMATPEAESGDNSFMGNVLAPWKKEMTTDKVLNNKNPGDFYDLKDELEVKSNSSKATEEDKMRSMYMDSVSWEMSDLYKKKREIQNSNLSDSTKYEQVKEIQDQINELSENALNHYNHVSIDGLYSEAGDKRYNKDAESGKWYEIKPKTADGEDNYFYQQEQRVTKALGISYGEYWNNRDEYDYAYNKPERYAVAQAVGGYDSYMEYYDVLENWQSDSYISADKDSKGNSISGSRKSKVLDYINGLDIDYGEKIILYRSVYDSKADKAAYNQDIVNYLNSRDDISYSEMEMILKHLGFDVDSQGNISW